MIAFLSLIGATVNAFVWMARPDSWQICLFNIVLFILFFFTKVKVEWGLGWILDGSPYFSDIDINFGGIDIDINCD